MKQSKYNTVSGKNKRKWTKMGSIYGMGRPKVASPRKVSAGFRMKEEDYEKLKRFASEHDLTQTEAIEKGLDLLYQQYQKAEL